MNCPVCGESTRIVDSVSDCESVYRRRKCRACGYFCYTTESELKSSWEDFETTAAQDRLRKTAPKSL